MEEILKKYIEDALRQLYKCNPDRGSIQIQETRKEFSGDFTVIIFPFTRYSRNTPEATGTEIGEYLVRNFDRITGFNVIKGFLNLVFSETFWADTFNEIHQKSEFGFLKPGSDARVILVEYSSPNTNKPLHLGHIRNNLLGFSLYKILTAAGNRVIKTNIVNDRGIHICKSMVAWLRHGNGETPHSSGIKGDHLVGKYYVLFDRDYRKEVDELITKGIETERAKEEAPVLLEARDLLRKWEAGDKETIDLWRRMNSWVYEGFDITYARLGVDFDKIYYESETYLRGKDIVSEALDRGFLYSRDDGSVWADLTEAGLDHKLLLRSDGTAVYMTQDLGTAVIRHEDYNFDQTIYVVGNEQNYHFQVLASLLKRIGYQWASGLHHFSYGMVELPEGKMKSREGKVVDADDLIDEMIFTARTMSEELGKLDDLPDDEKEEVFRQVGLGALKYFILKVDPRKNMTFNPQESIDFNGNTGPFIQYTFARINSVLKKSHGKGLAVENLLASGCIPMPKETDLIRMLRRYPTVVSDAANQMNPSVIANYVYELAREYNQFYHEFSILNEPDIKRRDYRLLLSAKVAEVIKSSMSLLGIEMPGRM
ncbi:MAG: arginine--tRNA ligase [Bacteroidales bacterium]|nr:arginine--tRNA ligase [Bacteroidales bacterium]